MSISVLCDNRCTVTFKKKIACKYRRGILKGYREPTTKLWRFPHAGNTQQSGQQVEPQINAILPDGTMSDTLNFLHRSMGSPSNNTLLNAIRKNNLYMWPFFTEKKFPSFYQIQYPLHWGTKNKHGNTHILLKNQQKKTGK